MTSHSADVYEFGPFRLEPAERRLLRAGQEVALPPKAFDVLMVLVSRAGRLVSKEELLDEVWRGTFVEETSLTYTISLLRKALHTDSGSARYIDTVQKLGYRFTADVRTLAAVDSEPASQSASSAGQGPPIPVGPPVTQSGSGPGRLWRWGAVMTLCVLAGGVAGSLLFRQPDQSTEPRARFDEPVPDGIILADGDHPVISPDGRRIAFAGVSGGRRQLWIRPLDVSTPTPLAGTEGATSPFWSPDSRSLAFYVDRKLKRIDVADGHAITLCDGAVVDRAFGGAWDAGVILFSNGPIFRVAEAGGVPEPVTRLDVSRGERRHIVVGFLSDARRFVFSSDPPPGAYYVASLDTLDQRHHLDIGPASVIQGLTISRGVLLYTRESIVFAQRLDERTLKPMATPLTLAKTDPAPWPPRPSASRTGVVVFRSTWFTMRQLTWRGRDGGDIRAVGKPGLYTQVELSPSGTRAVVVRGGSGFQDRDLSLMDLATGIPTLLTSDPTPQSSPTWSPDERRIAFHSAQMGIIAPFVKDLESGKEERVFEPAETLHVDDWTTDGHLVLRTQGAAVFALPLEGERKLRVLADTRYVEDQLQVSTDNRWIAFNSDESGTWEVYVARFPTFTEKRQVSVAGGVQPRWRRDDRELFYLSPDGGMMAVPFNGDGTMTTQGRARELFKTSLNAPSFALGEFDVSADGQRFLILEPTSPRPQIFTFVLNWMDGLDK